MNKYKPVILKDADGREVGRYESTRDCAKFLGIATATLSYRIRKGGLFKGYECVYVNEEDALILPKSYERKQPPKKKDLSLTKYRLIEYKTKHNRICIMPCPFKDGILHINVGSVKCEQCPSFRGRDREKHIVACNYNQSTKL